MPPRTFTPFLPFLPLRLPRSCLGLLLLCRCHLHSNRPSSRQTPVRRDFARSRSCVGLLRADGGIEPMDEARREEMIQLVTNMAKRVRTVSTTT
jgi:hypothetical protein